MINIFHTQLEQRIFETLQNSIAVLGYEIIRVRLQKGRTRSTLQIMIDKPQVGIYVEDCAKVSDHASVLIDVNELLPNLPYSLEISSPGLNRPLTRIADLFEHIGQSVKVKTWSKVDGTSKFNGILKEILDNKVHIHCFDRMGSSIWIDLDNISEIALAPDTDAILLAAKTKSSASKL